MMAEAGLMMDSATRKKFERQGPKRLIIAFIVSALLNLALSLIVAFQLTHPLEQRYFATSINGRVRPLTALNEPNQSDSAVLQWANQAAIAAFTYDFLGYVDQLKTASAFFTPSGWRQFVSALEESNSLDNVKAKKLIISAVASRPPVILQKGILNDRYSWRVQMPILITYQSASEFSEQNSVVTMLITRISTLQSSRGIGISQLMVGTLAEGLT